MMNLTFGEQVKIILSRKGMTIKELAEQVEKYTGKPMSRQNMTQRLGRDNFQEQDMRLIAEILGCKFTLSIMETVEAPIEVPVETPTEAPVDLSLEREVTVEELLPVEEIEEEAVDITVPEKESEERAMLRKGISGFFRKSTPEPTPQTESEPEPEKPVEIVGEINPYTGREYESNSVRVHPKKIGYVQVYDQEQHKWTEMTEWLFLGYQERKKKLLGKDYKPPIYLD